MQNSKSSFFSLLRTIRDLYVCSDKDIKNFRVHRYFKSTHNKLGDVVSLPMFIMQFDEDLTSNYVAYIGKDGITITFQKWVFYVSTYSRNVLKGLNVHHNYYIDGKKPWEYPNDVLVTLCESCHHKRHENPVPCYRDLKMKDIIGYICNRCHGSGYLPEYKHVDNGVCFKCGGEGVIYIKPLQ